MSLPSQYCTPIRRNHLLPPWVLLLMQVVCSDGQEKENSARRAQATPGRGEAGAAPQADHQAEVQQLQVGPNVHSTALHYPAPSR